MNPGALDPIAVPLAGSHLIEASAGTGKTYAIATLYVRLLLERELAVSQILVVTYTNAATAELRLRIRTRLRETLAALEAGRWEGDEVLDAFIRGRCERGDDSRRRDRAVLLDTLHAFDEAAIFTIHGFCQRVLQENAFESGVPFESDLLENITGLIDEVVKDFWVARLYQAPSAFVRYLDDEAKISPENLRRIAFTVVAHPDIEVLPDLGATDETRDAGGASSATQALRFQLEFVDYVRRELRRRKDAARVQSFDDLLQHLRDALAGPGGVELAELVRERYRAALIDEFQDTDPVQYEIFDRLYRGTDAPLFLIGDPKQAIYAFRGADVFTYMDAKRRAGSTHTLLTNRRSDPSLLRAINTVFEQAAPAFLFEEIGYEAIAAPDGARDRLGGARKTVPPFEILFVGRRPGVQVAKNSPRMILTGPARELVTTAIAARVAALLTEGATIVGDDGERPVVSSDIAVLCRRNREAHEVQASLRRLGVHAVLQTDATVFETAEAIAVERTLRALANPSDSGVLRAALASSLIGVDAARLHALETDEARWDEWARRFREWHDDWIGRGFVSAFRGLLDALDVERQLLGRVGGERQLTDVLHLVELLHRAVVEQRLGPEALVQWLAQMRTDPDERAELLGDAARVRLESDEAAVKLVTIHRSKGLEYPIVFCPFSWDGTLLHKNDKKALRFHDRDDASRFKLDLGSPEFTAHTKIAETEALAENLRLLYVAFTRAKHYCGVVWGPINGCQTSALAYLLHQDKESDPASRVGATRNRVKNLSDDQMLEDLRQLAAASNGSIGIVELGVLETAAPPPVETGLIELTPPEIRRHDYPPWRTSSFSALTAGPLTPLASPDEQGIDHDTSVTAPAAETIEPAADQGLSFADLRGGARAGDFVHRILERLDFRYDRPEQLRERLESIVPRAAAERTSFDGLVAGMAELLDTPLGAEAGSLRLRDLPLEQRLNELEFLLPVAGERRSWLTPARLAEVFARHSTTPFETQYAERLAHLSFPALEGYLRGFIDLVFEHRGKWYVVDYKTTQAGSAVADYVQSALGPTMAVHHYLLQYHLYAVAVHRYLASRLRGYDYGEHFGGVYYLFLRGMSPRFPAGNGIWYDRPSADLIEDLSDVLAGGAERGDDR